MDPARQVMPLNGTREGLYNVAMALCPEEKRGQRPVVLIPNPFYQVYMIAAISVGAEPVFVPATAETGHLPDYAALPEEVLNRTVAAFVCSPANPQGAVASPAYWREVMALAEKWDFQVFSDECYSEIWRDAAPTGALEIAAETGADPERVLIFQSLSKRSNLPGLRSGFVAGGPQSIRRIRQLRAYAGAPCRCRCNGWPNGSGRTRCTWTRTARSTNRNTRRPTRFCAACRATRDPRPGSSCGCPSRTARRRR